MGFRSHGSRICFGKNGYTVHIEIPSQIFSVIIRKSQSKTYFDCQQSNGSKIKLLGTLPILFDNWQESGVLWGYLDEKVCDSAFASLVVPCFLVPPPPLACL